jgi:hypothetical protein
LATFIVVRYLKFPLVHFSNQERERKIKRYITIFALLLMVPSIFTLWTSYQENRFNSNVKSFVEENFDREYTDVITDYTTDSISVIYIHTNKNENNVTEGTLNKMLPKYDLEDVRVVLTDENAKFRAIQEELNQIKFGGLEMDNNEMLREYKKEHGNDSVERHGNSGLIGSNSKIAIRYHARFSVIKRSTGTLSKGQKNSFW